MINRSELNEIIEVTIAERTIVKLSALLGSLLAGVDLGFGLYGMVTAPVGASAGLGVVVGVSTATWLLPIVAVASGILSIAFLYWEVRKYEMEWELTEK